MPLTKFQKRKIEEEEKYRAKVRGKLLAPLQTKTHRSRILAGLLAIILGGIGIHKFYDLRSNRRIYVSFNVR